MTFRIVAASAVMVASLLAGAPVMAQDARASFTAAQAQRGLAEYKKSCLDCHGANLDDGEFGGPPLRGSTFESKYFGVTADALFGFMSSAMPPDRPGRLSAQTYADLTAYILSKNGVQPGSTELPSDLEALAGLTISK